MATKRELYDFEEFHAKALATIAKLKEQQPGQRVGKVGKNEVLESVKLEIKALVKAGYTIPQIAEAFKSDVFGVLPKTITEIVNDTAKKRKTKTGTVVEKSVKQDTPQTTTTQPLQQPLQQPVKSATFAIQPDEEV